MFAALALAATLALSPIPTDRAQADPVAFRDNFNGDQLRPIWHTRGTDYQVGSTLARGSRRAVDVGGGVLHLRVLRDRANPGHYLNGHIGTEGRFEFTRGWAAARVKVPPFAGSHAAFWIVTPTVAGDIAGHEVDVVESFGSPHPNAAAGTNVWHGVWYPDPDALPVGFPFVQEIRSTNSADFGSAPWHRDFHTYMVHWTPTRYAFWIDGVRVAVIRVGLTGVPKFLILSLLTRDWEVPDLQRHALDSYDMQVDWVAVWQKETP